MSEKQEAAYDLYNSGFNCAQSVLSAFCEDYGLDTESAMKIAGGMGGGFRSGEICGAASGAALVIGLKYGQNIPGDAVSKSVCSAKTREFIEAFKDANKHLTCRDLLGYDISGPEVHDHSLSKAACSQLVKSAVAILEQLGY
ncbi:MAG: C_GCAxxG_C_C family protein [Clostridiales bacterium]|nr:C_GCAxxG_C_C family protein [Clostridiales bacterium]